MFKSKWEIKVWLDEMKVTSYTINNDLTVDVDGDVKLNSKPLSQLPVQFGFVNGNFEVWNCKLQSLKGSPIKVTGKFNCGNNLLQSLEYCPREVGSVFLFHENNITTLEYAPDSVGIFKHCINSLKDLKGFKTQVRNYFEHGCDKREEQITEFEHLYEHFPYATFQYLLKFSAEQLKVIQQAEELKSDLTINETNQSKKLKL
jgi:hypothetical protein